MRARLLSGRRASARRALLALAIVAVAWAVVVVLTGGFGTRVAGIRVSSRNARNPLLFAVLASGIAFGLAGPTRRRTLAGDLSWWRDHAAATQRTAAALPAARWVDAPSIGACGGAGLLLFIWMHGPSLWLDEEMIALNIRDRSVRDLAGALWLGQSAPFGWLVSERLMGDVFGFGERSLRFLPVLFGIAAIAAAAWVGRRWMTTAAATVLVLLFSLGESFFHYSLELKHYSADIFFGLTLPALTVWVTEGGDASRRLRRAAIWWAVAAMAQWWAYGALFVTPACAIVICLILWRVDGWRQAARFCRLGIVWLASFAVHYFVALRFTLQSDYLREYWAAALPAATAGAIDMAKWLAAQMAPLAYRPGGTTLALLFWTVALCGLAFARHRVLLCTCAAVAAAAATFASLRIVPLYERLSLWMMPALYVAIASCVDAGARGGREGVRRRHLPLVVVAAVALAGSTWVCLDIARRGWQTFLARDLVGNHVLDDRSSVIWLMTQRQTGDAVLTTPLGIPALWWYGRIPISSSTGGGTMPDGAPILQVSYVAPPAACDDDSVRHMLIPYERVVVYIGFGFDQVPGGFDELLMRELALVGPATAFRRFGGNSRAAVVQVEPVLTPLSRDAAGYHAAHPIGCVSIQPAMRW
jgi:uncharacterized membrane protein